MRKASFCFVLTAGVIVLAVFGVLPAAAQQEIRIGILAPFTGSMAKPGEEARMGFDLFWEQAGFKAGGKTVKLIYADEQCNPDVGMNQARRLVHQEKVHLLFGPLCGHVGKPVAQVSGETGVPLLIYLAGADDLTKWNRVPTAIRPSMCSSQDAHPFGDWLYKEAGARNVTFIGQDYTFGQEKTLGAVAAFKALGGKVAKHIWAPLPTNDYGPLFAGIPADSDAVVVCVVGTDRLRLFEQWFDFGYNRKFKIYGLHWLQADALQELDDRAVGLISQSLPWCQGIDNPENKAFMDAFVKKYKKIPSYIVEMAWTTSLYAKTAIDMIKGNVDDRKAFLDAVRKAKVVAPRGPTRLDEYDGTIQNTYIQKVAKIKHPVLGDVLINVPVKTYTEINQFWPWTAKEFLARGPYKR
ncbi:MAG TPA: ABC transporter substrate-binding protein [Thermodesulfobacteriota bacterium]|nr:ABC transporter substrate-binding protein [Thermodesulfobacteriota bacterium]